MDIDTNMGTGFFVSTIPGDMVHIHLPFYSDENDRTWFRGDLTNPRHLRLLAAVLEWAEENGVDLKFDID